MSNPHRFYLPATLAPGSVETLPGPTAHHIRKVLRLRDGESVLIWNGDGAYREATLEFRQDGVRAHIGATLPPQPAPTPVITLIQALPESDKMDWIIEKACEAGVERVVPVQARRSVVRLSAERAAKRFEHWQRVAIAACSQCGRTRLPQIDPVSTAAAAFETAALHSLGLFLSPTADVSAGQAVISSFTHQANTVKATADAQLAGANAHFAVAIGPEGGWEAGEEADALRAGFKAVRLPGNTLRTETAGLYVVAQIRAWSDLMDLKNRD